MSLHDLILQEHSRAHAEYIAKQVLSGQYAFDELWQLVRSGEPPLPQRAAWALEAVTERAPHLFQLYMEGAVELLKEKRHPAVHRNLIKVFSRTKEIPECLQGELYSYCIDVLLRPSTPAAIQAFSMTLAANIARGIPELEEELATVIESQMPYNTAAYKSKGRRILSQLRKS